MLIASALNLTLKWIQNVVKTEHHGYDKNVYQSFGGDSSVAASVLGKVAKMFSCAETFVLLCGVDLHELEVNA